MDQRSGLRAEALAVGFLSRAAGWLVREPSLSCSQDRNQEPIISVMHLREHTAIAAGRDSQGLGKCHHDSWHYLVATSWTVAENSVFVQLCCLWRKSKLQDSDLYFLSAFRLSHQAV